MKAQPENTIRLNANWPEVEILYEDEALLAINKPAGLLTSPDRWDKSRDNLMGLLHQAIARQAAWSRTRQIGYLFNAHRLDCHTSGVLLLARRKAILTKLGGLFNTRAIKKTYTALVLGSPEGETFTVDLPIAPHPSIRGLSVIDAASGKPAQTSFTVQERFRRHALLRAEPATGRLHQIRVHLQAAGCPLVADRQYGNGRPLLLSELKPNYKFKANEPERPLMGRTALHAEEIAFPHPVTNAAIVIRAPWPKDLTIAVKYLRKFG